MKAAHRTDHSEVANFFAKNKALHISWLLKLHARAELSYQENETSNFIRRTLEEYAPSLHVSSPFKEAPTCILAVYEPSIPERNSMLLRADMDALPISGEKVESGHLNPGCHHACGHDGHVTCLLVAAHWLNSHPVAVNRKVVLLFQPAEENRASQAFSGGAHVIEKGLLDTLHGDVQSVFALHCWPGAPVGDVLVGEGCMMGSSARISIEFTGTGGHPARPNHLRSEPLLAACSLVTTGQSISARMVDPFETNTIAFCGVRNVNSSATNVCPDRVVVYGTTRTTKDDVHAIILDKLRQMAKSTALAYGCEVECDFRKGYPATINSRDGAAVAREAAMRVHGGEAERVHNVGMGAGDSRPSLCAEDFSFLLQKRGGAYIWLGNGVDSAMLHTRSLRFEDDAVEYGGRLFVELMLGRGTSD